ncbi:MAG TPA: DEAD/DEAH box helicase [Ktedonobacterales bacterium]
MTTETLEPSMALPTAQPTETPTDSTTSTIAPTSADAVTSFAELGAHPRAVARLAELGITTPTLIQARSIPPLLAGRDVVGQSRTGSGKTIAYGLPLIERIDPRLRRLQALVLVPTRELASQVAGVLFSLGGGRGLRVAQLIGGRSYLPQREALRMGAQIAVGAPGRVLDHLRQGTLDLSQVTFAVLDEADQMLDAGFAPDVERLLAAMPEQRQLALFTATLPEMTTQIARRYLHEPITVDAGTPESRPAPTVTQIAYTVPREHRLNALMTLLDRRREATGTTLVFGRTKHGVDKLARQLVARGYPVAALHGNMSQNARDRVIGDFRSGRAPTLVATNVAARGLDVLSIEQVINYELPESADLFTHRVGRTGRMDNSGEAITLLIPDDMAQWRRFQRDLAMKVKPTPFPLDELVIPTTPAAAPIQTPERIGQTPETPVAEADAADERRPAPRAFERSDRGDDRGDDRGGQRRWEDRPQRRFEGRGYAGARSHSRSHERGFERGHEHGDYERGADRSYDRDDTRPARREDAVSRWTRPAIESERRDDYRRDARAPRYEDRHEPRRERRSDDPRERAYDAREERSEPRRQPRRADRPGDRFQAERGERAPRRAVGPRSGPPAGRAPRPRSHRPTRG